MPEPTPSYLNSRQLGVGAGGRGGPDYLLGAESLGMPGECQPGTSHRCPCLCRPLGTAMAGDGELNRVIKDLQSKCASLSPASLSHLTLAMLGPSSHPARGQQGGVTARGAPEHPSANPTCAACSCPCCQPQGTSSAQRVPVPLSPPAAPFHPGAGSSFTRQQKSPGLGARRRWGGGWDEAGCPLPVPAQPCHPAETVAELNHGYREQNLPVTDGSRELHSLCAQLEFLLQVPCSSIPATPCLSFPWGTAGSRGDPVLALLGGGMTPVLSIPSHVSTRDQAHPLPHV